MKTPKEILLPTKIDEVQDFKTLREYLKHLIRYLEDEHTDTFEDLKVAGDKSGIDADKVDGFHASQSGGANKILPLDVNGNLVFPADKGIKTLVGVSAYMTADQLNIPDNTVTLVNLDTEFYDLGGDFNTTTHLFTAPVSGYYSIHASIKYRGMVADKRYYVYVKRNATVVIVGQHHSSVKGEVITACSKTLYLASGDTVGLYAHLDIGGDTENIYGEKPSKTFLTIHLLSVA